MSYNAAFMYNLGNSYNTFSVVVSVVNIVDIMLHFYTDIRIRDLNEAVKLNRFLMLQDLSENPRPWITIDTLWVANNKFIAQ